MATKITIRLILLVLAMVNVTPVFSAVADDIQVTRTTKKAPVNFFVGVAPGNASYDKANNSDVGLSIFAGIMPWRSLGFEIAYEYLGEPSVGNTSSVTKTSLFRGGLIARYQLNSGQLGSRVSIFGQTGLAMWDSETTSGINSISDSGVDIYYGLGSTVMLGGDSYLRIAVDFYSIDSVPNDDDITFISVGFQQEF